MKDHPAIRSLLLILCLSVAFAFEPRAASLERRKPEPNPGSIFSCCKKPPPGPKVISDPESDVVLAPTTASGKELEPPAAEYTGEYPTELSNPYLSPSGKRVLAGVIALSKDHDKVIVIQDRNKFEGWRLPEGDCGVDDREYFTAVYREAWQTAGLIPAKEKVPEYVGEIQTQDYLSQYYRFVVKERHEHWPNVARWDRQWLPIDEAADFLSWGFPQQAKILRDSVKTPVGL